MIPKKIHYCWFGGNSLTELAKKCIESWKKFCPDYEIVEWNEDNYDVECCEYIKEAYQSEKWAFVSDYARLDIVYTYGGIYLDTDVELIKSLDEILNLECFLGTQELGTINTGLGFGAEAKNKYIGLMLKEYNCINFKIGKDSYDFTPCTKRNTAPFLNLGFVSENRIQKIEGIIIYPPEYFCPLNYATRELTIKKNTIAIHHFSTSWISEEERMMLQDIKKFRSTHGKISCFIYKNCYEYKMKYKNFKLEFLMKFIWKKVRRKIYKLFN